MADVESGCFYTEAANWAVENGVIHGVEKDGELCFDPDASIPREQLCVMIANAAHELCGRSIEGASRAKLEAMPDAQSVPEWAGGLDCVVFERGRGERRGRKWDTLRRAREHCRSGDDGPNHG